MYRKPKRISGPSLRFENYVSGYDLYDSLILKELGNQDITRETYVITKYEFRPDLIARDIYGSSEYMWALMMQCSISLEDYKIGQVLTVLPKSYIESIISLL